MALVKKLFIFLIGILLLGYIFYRNDGNLGKGDYFIYYTGYDAIKSRTNKNIYLSDIRQVEYDDNHIIALRIRQKHYSCNDESLITVSIKKLQYVIIDKKTNKIYTTYDKNKFYHMKEKLEIPIKFIAYSENRVRQRLKSNTYNNELNYLHKIKQCREDYLYPEINLDKKIPGT
jgi:hypothetical protein